MLGMSCNMFRIYGVLNFMKFHSFATLCVIQRIKLCTKLYGAFQEERARDRVTALLSKSSNIIPGEYKGEK